METRFSSSTAPQLGNVYEQIQAQYGAKTAPAREIKKTLGKDDFLKIMITQLQHQDPTDPMKSEKMATEMAQFTTVEQLQNMNQQMGRFLTQNKPMEQMAMTHLIGKTVTVDRQRFPHRESEPSYLGFQLPRDASQVHVSVLSEAGEEIFSKNLGSQKAGASGFSWDGTQTGGFPAKSGTYRVKVAAIDEKQMPISLDSSARVQVVGVSFEGVEPVFLVGDPKQPEKMTLKNMVRIEL